MTKLFGTDGIRGVAGELLTPELAYKVGAYAGEILKTGENDKILIARDTRASGSMLKSAMAAGFMAVGVDVVDLGVVPTPAVSLLISDLGFIGGVMISASHNPYYDNGIKIFDGNGYKLSEEKESQIEDKIYGDAEFDLKTHKEVGQKTYGVAIRKTYEQHLKDIVDGELNGMKVAIDCGNGAVYEMAPRLLQELGARVYSTNTDPDGYNINDSCGSTDPSIIQKMVVENNCDIGFSFDGDADRVIAADSEGNLIDGDHFMAILATDLKERDILKNDTVVATVMSNMGLGEYLESIGVDLVQTDVGDKNVLDEMVKGDFPIGGEKSGHLIIKKLNTSGDGMASALSLMNILKHTDKTSAELNTLYEDYPQVLINAKIKAENRSKFSLDLIADQIEEYENILKDTGRINIRPSGTEPVIRVMVEGKDLEQITKMAKDLVKIIEEELR